MKLLGEVTDSMVTYFEERRLMHRFEAFPSRAKLVGLFLMNILLIAMCVFCINLPGLKAKLWGWIGVAFFGIGLITIPRAFFRASSPKIAMDEKGIHTGSSIGSIDWADIVGFRVDAIKGSKFISVFVRDKSKYLERMSPLARKSVALNPLMGLSEITLNFVGLSPGLNEACAYLEEKGFNVFRP